MTATYETITGNTTTAEHNSSRSNEVGGVNVVGIGTFGSGTLTIQQLHGDGVWRAIPGGAYTSSFGKVVDVASGTRLRAVMTGSTTPSVFVEFVNLDRR